MRPTTLALAAVIGSATLATAFAQQPPAPGAAPPPPPRDADAPPPPPPRGPKADRPPPPGASIELDRGGPAGTRLVVRCAERDSTQDCASIATSLLAKMDAAPAK